MFSLDRTLISASAAPHCGAVCQKPDLPPGTVAQVGQKTQLLWDGVGWGCSSAGRASDRHAAEARLITCKGRLSLSYGVRTSSCATVCINICSLVKYPVVHVREFVDYGSTKTPRMRRRSGSATLSQLAFPGESHPSFPRKKSQWDNTAVK